MRREGGAHTDSVRARDPGLRMPSSSGRAINLPFFYAHYAVLVSYIPLARSLLQHEETKHVRRDSQSSREVYSRACQGPSRELLASPLQTELAQDYRL